MKRKTAPKPRNPYVQHLVVRKSGAHVKSNKAKRRGNKIAIKKEMYNAI